MAFTDHYLKQSTLMLQILPIVAKQKDFALKGGTAINYFYRDMPRISVDIDLIYLPIMDRQATILGINANMKGIEKSLNKDIWRTLPNAGKQEDAVLRLRIYENDVQVKVETNGIFRGTVFPPQLNRLSDNAANAHGIQPLSYRWLMATQTGIKCHFLTFAQCQVYNGSR